MKLLLGLIFTLFFLSSCNKPRTVLICGDHICINKGEAKQYFEENLTLEVKLIDKKKIPEINLIELNLRQNNTGDRTINVYSKENTKKKIRTLSSLEINEIKKNIINKKIKKKNIKKKAKLKNKKKKFKNVTPKENITKNNKVANNNVNKNEIKNLDICTKVENCSIDEISKYLLKQGMKNKFPDITIRQ